MSTMDIAKNINALINVPERIVLPKSKTLKDFSCVLFDLLLICLAILLALLPRI